MKAQGNRELYKMVARIPRGIETKDGAPDLEMEIKKIRDEIIAEVGGGAEKMRKMQDQLDAIDMKISKRYLDGGDSGGPTVHKALEENEGLERLMHDKRGRAVIELNAAQTKQLFERKTTLTTTGGASLTATGVLQIDRMLGITDEARERLTIRDVLSAAPTEMQVIDYVKVSTPLQAASPQVEANSKFENTIALTSLSERVKLFATFVRASRQILDDLSELENFLRSSLAYEVDLAEELELLSGSGTGEHLNGLITVASAFNGALLSTSKGWNTMDIIGRAIQQIRAAKEIPPTFVVLHPNSWWEMRLTKDQFGRYILGDPQSEVVPTLFGMRVVETTNISDGTFLVGSGDPAATQIRDRMGMMVDISTEDADNFTKNLVTVRAEKRLALVTRRPGSFVRGTFSTSPA